MLEMGNLFQCLSPEDQVKLANYQWKHYKTKLDAMTQKPHGEIESPEEPAHIMFERPCYSKDPEWRGR